MYHCSADNLNMDVENLEKMIQEFQSDTPLTEGKSIMLMKAVPDRMHTIIPGLIIADTLARQLGSSSVSYSDTGVREGFICAEILPTLK
jgi:exopolyphosphatase/guanosine-5'-triphosphate,3'-diphosphate pyrophosphatase